MNAWKSFFYWCAAAIISVLIGGVLVKYLGDVSWLSWLAFGADFGFGSTTIDLTVIKFTCGLWININVCQIVLLLISGVIYYFLNRK